MRYFRYLLWILPVLMLGAGAAHAQSPPTAPPGFTTNSVGLPQVYLGDVVLVDLARLPADDPLNVLGDPFSMDRMDVVMAGLQAPLSVIASRNSPLGRVYPAMVMVERVDVGQFNFNHSFGVRNPGANLNVLFSDVAVADYDLDGDLDLVSLGATSSVPPYAPVTQLYRHDGAFGFQTTTTLAGLHSGAAAWGDYDNDGDADLLLTGMNGTGQHQTILYRNDRDGSFSGVALPALPGLAFSDASWADYDGDADLDLALTGAMDTGDFLTRIYRNDGGTFVDIDAGLPGLSHSRLAWFDADGDGKLDLLITGGFLNPFIMEGRTVFYRNLGGDLFEEVPFDGPDLFGGDLEVGDLDNDGDYDFMVSGQRRAGNPDQTFLYRNDFDQGGSFTEHHRVSSTVGSAFALGDHDWDGDLDIFITGFDPMVGGLTPPQTQYYVQSGVRINVAPLPPENLQARFENGRATFEWTARPDDHTPTPSLTYNLRVGTAPGLSDIMAPLSDPQTGRRWLPAAGNTGTTLRWRIEGLAPGTYYWSVQAIDAHYVGSAFAPEQTFTTGDQSDTTPPATPQDLRSTGGVREVLLTWQPNTEADLSRYRLYRGTSEAPEALLVTLAADEPSYLDTDVVGGTTYFYRLTAVDVSGNESGFSNEVQATPAVRLFTDSGVNISSPDPGSLAWGDFDRDGFLDLALATDGSRLFRNLGDGRLTFESGSFSDAQDGQGIWGDYDNDGDLDLFLTGRRFRINTFAGVAILYRNDEGVFTDVQADIEPMLNSRAAWGDYDRDGDLDLAVGGFAEGGALTFLYRNEGGTFVRLAFELQQATDGSLEWGDYDGDDDLDLLIGGSPRVLIMRNEGDEVFQVVDPGLDLGAPFDDGAARFGDYDNDGDLDLAVAARDVARIYRNDDGAFADIGAALVGVRLADVAWGDYDADGDLDLVVAGASGGSTRTTLYRNDVNQDGLFTEVDSGLPGLQRPSLAWGDYDRDANLDLAVMGDRTSTTRLTTVMHNNLGVVNQSPVLATGSASVVSSEGVTELTWEPGADAETPTAGLTYNLRVGTTPGGLDIVAPMSLADGTLLLPRRGNAGSTPVFRLEGLAPGTYYWSVQAVDPGFAASSFTDERSFEVTGNNTQRVDTEQPATLRLALAPVFPNPFRERTEIRYTLAAPGAIRLAVYDVLGRAVKVLAEGYAAAGAQAVAWDGRGDDGRRLGSGLYLLRLEAGGKRLTRTLTLVQ